MNLLLICVFLSVSSRYVLNRKKGSQFGCSCIEHTLLREVIHIHTHTHFLWAISKVFFILHPVFFFFSCPSVFFLPFVVLMSLMFLYSLFFSHCLSYCQIPHALSLNIRTHTHIHKRTAHSTNTHRFTLLFLIPSWIFPFPLDPSFFPSFFFSIRSSSLSL